jgi:hypothetical protein
MSKEILGYDNSSVDPSVRKRIMSSNASDIDASGVFCEALREGVPEYIQAGSEKVINNANNSWIVLGRDRPRSKSSGYGGKGHTHAGSLDMVCGRMGRMAKERFENGERASCDPDFIKDAARIYISQKTDIDENFNLVLGSMENSKAKSGIGIKADAVRIIGREGIKLVTRTDIENSQGTQSRAVYGIDLIAGNDDEQLEPMVKGNKLVACLMQLVEQIDNLNGIVDNMLTIQTQFNNTLTNHFHQSPFLGLKTSPSITVAQAGVQTGMNHLTKTKASLASNKTNLQSFKTNYLTSGHTDLWILSRYNNVN